jgi:asparagine synthase (glutamine-hydrolysing)
MGGIAGIFYPDVPKPVGADRVRAMADMLVHRGPDGSGVWTAPGIGLGQCRLAAADLEGGSQPMLTPDARVAISFDGVIHNFREVRADLERKGFAFRTDGDTEVILAAWRQWGPKCLGRFNGSFALALYDLGSDSLFIARDRLGVKPLFYSRLADGAVVFGSELKALLAHPLFRAEPDPHGFEDYVAFGFLPDDASIVAGVKKLPAAHFLHIRRGRSFPKPVRWWDSDFTTPSTASGSSLGDELADLLRESVRSRMDSAVPPGAFLGEDLNSAALVAFMADASRSAVDTYSMGEASGGTQMVSDRFATNRQADTGPIDDFRMLDAVIEAFDEPFGDPSAIISYRMAALARGRTTTALTGEGGAELFGGHRRYRAFARRVRARGLVPDGIRAAATQPRSPRFVQALGRPLEESYADALVVVRGPRRFRLYRPHFKDLLDGHRAEHRVVRAMQEAPAVDALSRAQYADLQILIPGSVLARLDRTGMALGLDTRVPLLDHRLVEFAGRVPSKMRVRGSTGNWLMRKALERHLPREILSRADTPVTIPTADWFRGPLADYAGVARSSALAELGWLDEAAVARLAADHRAGKADHGQMLWQLLMLEGSLQRLFGLGRSSSYVASTKYRPSGGALKPRAARSRA